MPTQSRFQCPSALLTLTALLRPTRVARWIGVALAIALHAALSQVGVLTEERGSVRPLTTQFVKRQPRLTKPLELKKRPQPKRRLAQRTMVAVKARTRGGQRDFRVPPVRMLGGLDRPKAQISRMAGLAQRQMEPQSFASGIEGAREPKDKIDMSLELLDINALNTGRYHALVVQDPTDKQNITGFLNLAYIYSDHMTGMDVAKTSDMTFYGVTRLVDRMNEWTQIRTRIAGRFTFDSSELFQTPWVYTRAGYYSVGWKIPYSQAVNLGEYLQEGGFWIPDGLQGGPGVGQDVSLRNAVKDALATVDHKYGRDWVFQKLPFDHAVFHCFFEFPDGAPVSADTDRWGPSWASNYPVEGVFFGERLVVLYTNKNFILGWVGRSPLYPQYDFDGTRVFQFGVNTIVFALTQAGSITHRLMSGME